MVISFSHRFIFVHIYKVAGTSVENALDRYVHTPTRLQRHVASLASKSRKHIPPLQDRAVKLPMHAAARDIRDAYSQKTFKSFFKFAFVRNPWDWQVSLYKYARQTPEHPQYDMTRGFASFEEYIKWRVAEGRRLQKSFVTNESGELIVDFIGRLEDIELDFEAVTRKIGIDASLPHLNKSKRRKDYRAYYTDLTAGLVEEAFREDVELFGYRFEPLVTSDAR